VLDATREVICPEDLSALRERPETVDPVRWVSLLVAEIERLRRRLKDAERRAA
jgi:hypothetical protein